MLVRIHNTLHFNVTKTGADTWMAECRDIPELITEDLSLSRLYLSVEDVINGWISNFDGEENEFKEVCDKYSIRYSDTQNENKFKFLLTVSSEVSTNKNNVECLSVGSSGVLSIEDYGGGRYLTYREDMKHLDKDDKRFKSGAEMIRMIDEIRYALPYKNK